MLALLTLAAITPRSQAVELSLQLDSRLRTEYLENGFRPVTPTYDSVNSAKTLMLGRAYGEHWYAEGELEDSRAYAYKRDSFIDAAYINTLEPLQLKVGWRGELDDSRHLDVSFGRTTIQWQEGHLFGRQGFRTTIESFSGLKAVLSDDSGWQLEGIALNYNPITPTNLQLEQQRGLERSYDSAETDTRIVGLNLSGLKPTADTQLATYGVFLTEKDTPERFTTDRELLTLGMHLTGERQSWTWLAEGALQVGERSTTRLPQDNTTRDVLAGFVHLEAERAVSPDLSMVVLANYASGDSTPTKGTLTNFDPLYTSARKADYSFTGLWGVHINRNILSPGVRFHWTPDSQFSVMLRYRMSWQHATDLTGGGLEFKGHDVEVELTLRPENSAFSFQTGIAYFVPSGTLTQQQATNPGNSLYVFADVMLHFDWES